MNLAEQDRPSENRAETESGGSSEDYPEKLLSFLGQDLKPDAAPPPPVPLWLFIAFTAVALSLIVISIIPYESEQVLVPMYIYVAAGLGTGAYLFTNIASNKVQTFTPLQATTRFLAGPLVASGGYLLSQILLEESLREGLPAAGIAFLAGFFMEVFVQAFNVFAHRLLRLPSPESTNRSNLTGERPHNEIGDSNHSQENEVTTHDNP